MGGGQKHVVKVQKTVLASDTGPTKLFQTSSSWVMVVKKLGMPDPEGGQHVVLHGQPLVTVQYLQAATSEVMKEALCAASCVPISANGFGMTIRAATSDKLAANTKAERHLVADRGEKWVSLHASCDIHCTAAAQTKTLALMGDFVGLLVNLSLSIRVAGNMQKFRASLKAVVHARLQVIVGYPPSRAVEYKEQILDLFLS